MKLIGMLLVFGLILYLTYFVAGDFMGFKEGGSGEMQVEPLKAAAEAREKLDKSQEDLRKRLEEVNR